MPGRGNPAAVALGPGYLFAAPLGSTLPTMTVTGGLFSDAWPAAFRALGYTEEGSTQTYAPDYEDVEVAEELEAIDSIATGRTISVNFDLAENTAKNYQLAMNGGTIAITGSGATAVAKFTPPALGIETLKIIGFEAEDRKERWIWYQCKQVGSMETNRRKGAAKALIPGEFRAYKPSDGVLPPFERWSCRAVDTTV